MKYILIILASILFIGCTPSYTESNHQILTAESARNLDIYWWDIQLPQDITPESELEVYFVDSKGNPVGVILGFVIHSTERSFVRVVLRPMLSSTDHSFVGNDSFRVDFVGSENRVMTTIHTGELSTEYTQRTSKNSGLAQVGDILMLFAKSGTLLEQNKVNKDQIALTTQIKKYK